MIREDIVDRIAKKLRNDGERIIVGGNKEFYKRKYHLMYSKPIIRVVLKAFLELLPEAIAEGEDIILDGYFRIQLYYSKEHEANNPQNHNSKFTVPAQYRVRIKPGKFIKEACKKYNEQQEDNECTEE